MKSRLRAAAGRAAAVDCRNVADVDRLIGDSAGLAAILAVAFVEGAAATFFIGAEPGAAGHHPLLGPEQASPAPRGI